MTITPGYWKTRGGRKVRVLCVDAPRNPYCCVGYECESGLLCAWTVSGDYENNRLSSVDLIAPWTEPKPRRVAWVGKYNGEIRYLSEKPGDNYERATWLPDEPQA